MSIMFSTIARRYVLYMPDKEQLIAHLASLHQYPNGPHAAQSLARYWFQYHKNRPAMKDELRKAGYVET